jgi:hypothetical protein
VIAISCPIHCPLGSYLLNRGSLHQLGTGLQRWMMLGNGEALGGTHQSPHKKRLIDVAHAHLVFEEVNKVFVFCFAV